MKKPVLTSICFFFCTFLPAQDEAPDCKDHPLFRRMNNVVITECIQKVEKTPVRTADDQTETKDGIVTDIDYGYNGGESSAPAFNAIVKYHESIIQKLGGKKIYEGKDAATFSASTPGKNIWLQVNDLSNISAGNYGLLIIEAESDKIANSAKEMGDQLSQNGKVIFYFGFDKNKADLKPEMQKTLNQLAAALRQHPLTKISIEAHTDLNDSENENQSISEAEAKNIMSYLNSKGTGKFRMQAKGWGQSKPAGDKSTAEGRARNKRVEIIRLD
jgi:outer membrane protein OmpA-like peptidoglycan-associated protein